MDRSAPAWEGTLHKPSSVRKVPPGGFSEAQCHAGVGIACWGLLPTLAFPWAVNFLWCWSEGFLSSAEKPSSEVIYYYFTQVTTILARLLFVISFLPFPHAAYIALPACRCLWSFRNQLLLLPPCSGWKGSKKMEKSHGYGQGGRDRLEVFLINILCPLLPWGWGAPHKPGLIAQKSVLKVSTGTQGTPWKWAEQPNVLVQNSATSDLADFITVIKLHVSPFPTL